MRAVSAAVSGVESVFLLDASNECLFVSSIHGMPTKPCELVYNAHIVAFDCIADSQTSLLVVVVALADMSLCLSRIPISTLAIFTDAEDYHTSLSNEVDYMSRIEFSKSVYLSPADTVLLSKFMNDVVFLELLNSTVAILSLSTQDSESSTFLVSFASLNSPILLEVSLPNHIPKASLSHITSINYPGARVSIQMDCLISKLSPSQQLWQSSQLLIFLGYESGLVAWIAMPNFTAISGAAIAPSMNGVNVKAKIIGMYNSSISALKFLPTTPQGTISHLAVFTQTGETTFLGVQASSDTFFSSDFGYKHFPSSSTIQVVGDCLLYLNEGKLYGSRVRINSNFTEGIDSEEFIVEVQLPVLESYASIKFVEILSEFVVIGVTEDMHRVFVHRLHCDSGIDTLEMIRRSLLYSGPTDGLGSSTTNKLSRLDILSSKITDLIKKESTLRVHLQNINLETLELSTLLNLLQESKRHSDGKVDINGLSWIHKLESNSSAELKLVIILNTRSPKVVRALTGTTISIHFRESRGDVCKYHSFNVFFTEDVTEDGISDPVYICQFIIPMEVELLFGDIVIDGYLVARPSEVASVRIADDFEHRGHIALSTINIYHRKMSGLDLHRHSLGTLSEILDLIESCGMSRVLISDTLDKDSALHSDEPVVSLRITVPLMHLVNRDVYETIIREIDIALNLYQRKYPLLTSSAVHTVSSVYDTDISKPLFIQAQTAPRSFSSDPTYFMQFAARKTTSTIDKNSESGIDSDSEALGIVSYSLQARSFCVLAAISDKINSIIREHLQKYLIQSPVENVQALQYQQDDLLHLPKDIQKEFETIVRLSRILSTGVTDDDSRGSEQRIYPNDALSAMDLESGNCDSQRFVYDMSNVRNAVTNIWNVYSALRSS